MTYIGVDNGISGALCALSDVAGIYPIGMIPMPIQKARKGNEIDAKAVWKWMQSIDSLEKMCVVIEEPGGSKSAKSATSMAGSFHAIRAILEIKEIRWHRITPQIWQKEMLPGCKSGDTKPRALSTAKALWPEQSWLLTPRCSVPDTGLVDSALIAEYARRKNL